MNQFTLIVKGEASLSVRPDLILIRLQLSAVNTDYSKTIDKSNNDLDSLRNALKKVGFTPDTLKTTNFKVTTEYERVNVNNQWIEKFVGFNCTHDLLLEFDYDITILNRLINAIQNSDTSPKYDIKFSVKDSSKVKEQLIQIAVNDAKTKAKQIESATNISLAHIIKINYTGQDLNFVSQTSYDNSQRHGVRLMAKSIDIVPLDIICHDHIIIEWEYYVN
ncbi:MAG: SIMPL domain-containing protein [Christensenellaceae bacterium]|jgi:uncharacterized protein YggE|nr:SIMPL domain-containing protein [Christensenellaceae bacterium]